MSASAPQGSSAWLFERVGHCTSSRFADVMALKKDGKPKAERAHYLWELVIERLTGNPSDHWTSSAMLWGTENEPFARMAYEARTGRLVEKVGFIKHPTVMFLGGSPDGLIDEDGGFEAKCPFNSENHLLTLRDGMPEEHIAQVQGGMWINNREWWDFASFDPRMPQHLQLYVQRIARDEKYIDKLQESIGAFLEEVAEQQAKFMPQSKQQSEPSEV